MELFWPAEADPRNRADLSSDIPVRIAPSVMLFCAGTDSREADALEIVSDFETSCHLLVNGVYSNVRPHGGPESFFTKSFRD